MTAGLRATQMVYEQTDLREAETLREWRARTHPVPVLNRRRWWVGIFFGGIKG